MDAAWSSASSSTQVHDAKLSVNDLVIKALALALRRVPEANASFDRARRSSSTRRVDIGMAVAIEDGLITPVVRDADKKSIGPDRRARSSELAERARASASSSPRSSPARRSRCRTSACSAIERFAAIINPPEAGILAVGTSARSRSSSKGDKIVVGQRMTLTLSCDHRVDRRRARRQAAAGDRRAPREADLAGVVRPTALTDVRSGRRRAGPRRLRRRDPRARSSGFKTACVERESPGGICLNWGCIPTKALLKSAEHDARTRSTPRDFGVIVEGRITFDWDKVIARSRGVADKLASGVEFLFKKNGVDPHRRHREADRPREAGGRAPSRRSARWRRRASSSRPARAPSSCRASSPTAIASSPTARR